MSAEISPMPRNAPCPCGSGRRYKDCHGAIAASPVAAGAPPSAAPRPTYRPPGPDWNHLSEAERDFCGGLMQRALKQQCEGRLGDAAANYAQVLSRAPNTHDALHMLGAIELRRGNFPEAKKLIRAALALRPPYPDIEHNLRMVEDLERAQRVDAGRPSAPPEMLCERALPALADLALRPRVDRASTRRDGRGNAAGDVHLIAGVRDSNGDAAWLVRRLAALLAKNRPTVWNAAQARQTDPGRFAGEHADGPDGGCHIFVGIDVDGDWVDRAHAERVIVFYQPAPPSQCLDRLRAISRHGARSVELVFPSRAVAARFGAGHAVLPPPIIAEVASTGAEPHAASPDRSFTIGLIGPHFEGTSPGDDADYLHRLAAQAGSLEIYDPGPLRYVVGGDPAVRCRSRTATALREFLRSIDCLVHPNGKWWHEGDGRELFMAMAAGVPIICPYASIFAEYIEHGGDGVLYGVRGEALAQVAELRRSPARRADLGRAARAKIAALVAPDRVAGNLRRLLLSEPASSDARGAVIAREPVAAK